MAVVFTTCFLMFLYYFMFIKINKFYLQFLINDSSTYCYSLDHDNDLIYSSKFCSNVVELTNFDSTIFCGL